MTTFQLSLEQELPTATPCKDLEDLSSGFRWGGPLPNGPGHKRVPGPISQAGPTPRVTQSNGGRSFTGEPTSFATGKGHPTLDIAWRVTWLFDLYLIQIPS
ncbi:hypothetical protein JTE90_023139 [Oedothorax gibbosus]|uniref:Uncharacterized protein n=1 Tax=Oedothorax gibbosus TaxID=931172 RepID=A0AAV6URG8_9ARAC|nr:hypothetical protein JTE90_023139 [Oedothorax gibbosus]